VPELTARRKADREAMAAQVAQLAAQHGITARAFIGRGPRCVGVDLDGPHGLKVTVEFDGTSDHPDIWVLSWHGVDDGWQLDPCWFGHVNQYHGHKATDVVHGFEALMRMLCVRFAAIADGYAFIQVVPDAVR
jgi:hypothetical protein